jgi:hypothetical protein
MVPTKKCWITATGTTPLQSTPFAYGGGLHKFGKKTWYRTRLSLYVATVFQDQKDPVIMDKSLIISITN